MKISSLWKNALPAFLMRSTKTKIEPIRHDEHGREVLREFEHRLPSIDPEMPFIINGVLERSSSVYGYILKVDVCNTLHPHDPHFRTGFFGDANKNPTFLPAMKLLRLMLPSLVQSAMRDARMSQRSMDSFEARRPIAFADHSDGMHLLIRLNPLDSFSRPANYQAASEAQIVKVFDAIAENIQQLLPPLQQSIDDNKHLHPDKNDQIAAMGHLGSLFAHRSEVMLSAGIAVVAGDADEEEALMGSAQQQGLDSAFIAKRDKGGIMQLFQLKRLNR